MLLLSYLSYAVNNLVLLALYYREVLLKLKSVVVPTAVPCGGGVSHLLVCRNWRLHTYLEQGLQTTVLIISFKGVHMKLKVVALAISVE